MTRAAAAGLAWACLVSCGPELNWSCEGAPGDVQYLEDIDHLAGVERVCGDLRLGSGIDTVTALAQLQVIEGSLLVESTELQALTLPNLLQVEGHLGIVDNPQLVAFDAPALESVGGELAFVANPELEGVACDALDTVEGSVLFARNSALSSLELPGLRETPRIELVNNDALQAMPSLPQLNQLELLVVSANQSLASLSLGTTLDQLDELLITDNLELTSIELGAMTRFGSVRIARNAALEQVDALGSSPAFDRLFVTDNPQLRVLTGLGPGVDSFSLYVANNAALEQLGDTTVERIKFATIIFNPMLSPDVAAGALAGVEVEFLKIDGNAGQPIPHPDSCPWVEDFECDELEHDNGLPGTGLCLVDELDCMLL